MCVFGACWGDADGDWDGDGEWDLASWARFAWGWFGCGWDLIGGNRCRKAGIVMWRKVGYMGG